MSKFLLIVLFAINISAKQAELVDLQKIDPTILVDLVFATGNNPIVDIPIIMYSKNTPAYVYKETAQALVAVQQELNSYGYCLKIRDGYRPLWAQKILWEEVQKLNLPHQKNYISDPVVEGGRHTRGTAVDLTIIDRVSGEELAFPPFCFGELAHRDYHGSLLTEKQIKNRDFLRSVMIKHGFSTIRAEWCILIMRDGKIMNRLIFLLKSWLCSFSRENS